MASNAHLSDVPVFHEFQSTAFRQAMAEDAPDPVLRDVLRCMCLEPQRSDAWYVRAALIMLHILATC